MKTLEESVPELRLSRILIVDDHALGRETIREAIESLGFKNIDEAVNGAEALVLLVEGASTMSTYGAVLCDWNMPKINGIELLRSMRKMKEYSKTPFIMITAESDQRAVVEAMREGTNDYLTKPFSQDAIRRKLMRLIQKYGLR